MEQQVRAGQCSMCHLYLCNSKTDLMMMMIPALCKDNCKHCSTIKTVTYISVDFYLGLGGEL